MVDLGMPQVPQTLARRQVSRQLRLGAVTRPYWWAAGRR
jgi:hypothetical protein